MTIQVVVEIPKGSKNKYERNEETGEIMLDRTLYGTETFPFDYGFAKGTLGQDGDPLDVALLVTNPTFSGCVVQAEVIGYLELEDEGGIDHKILAVPVAKVDHRWAEVRDIADMPEHLKKEIKNFFETYKMLEPNKWVKAGEFKSREEAEKVVQEAQERKK